MATTVATLGATAPDFALGSSRGNPCMLSSLRGHPVVLVFSPPEWDPALEQKLESYNAIVSSIPGASAQLLSIAADGMWHEFEFAGDRVSIPVMGGLDPNGETAKAYDIHGTFALVVIDAHGVIRWKHIGDATTEDIEALVSSLALLAPDPASPRSLFDTDTRTQMMPTRREFVASALAAACLVAAKPWIAQAEPVVERLSRPPAGTIAGDVSLNVNGRALSLSIEPRVTLLDALREYAGLTGTKKGCDHGQCGACTVHINGRRQLSCMTFAIMHQSDQITTVEGLATGNALHPMQASFIKHDGFQCGYCTPGQLMSATALMTEPCGPADADVKECMSGNICRCGAYPGIVAAIQEVRTSARG